MLSSTDPDIPTLGRTPLSLTPRPSLRVEPKSDQGHRHDVKHSNNSSHTPGLAQPESLEDICQDNVNGLHEGTDGFEWLSIMAGAVISIQVQLLTSSSMASSTIPRILLTVGLMSELIGVMLVIYFIRFHKKHRRKSSNIYRTAIRVLSELPTLFIFMGIIGVIAALVVDMFDVSVGTAIAMSGVLSLGVVFFVVAWCFGIGRGAAT